MILPRTSEGLYLLQRIRDEAHRFAITHHRVPALQDDGREPARRRARASARCAARRLLKHFGSLKKLRAATVEEIAEVPGHRRPHRRRRSGRVAAGRAAGAATAVSVNTATGEIEES